MIDIQKARIAFKNYIQNYNINDPKIKLKLVHTYQVMKITDYLCQHEHIVGDRYHLALLIALLHDIGRFEQLKRYNSFSDDNIDHASLAVDILFNEGLIDTFIDDRQYDHIIKDAIGAHSLYKIPHTIKGESLIQTQLIRDSDKLDNFRVKNIETVETLLDINEDDFCQLMVSENIYNDIKNHRLILKNDRHNEMDMYVSYIAFIFDLNFKSSYLFIKENDYINKNIFRYHYYQDNEKIMQDIANICNTFINKKINE